MPLVNFERPVVVTAGPYDDGQGGPRVMGSPVTAGGAADTAAVTVPRPEPGSLASRARLGAGLMVISDVVFVAAIYLGFVYLHALNTMGQFRPASEPVPTMIGNVPVTVGALAAAAVWTWGHWRQQAGSGRMRAALTLAWILMVADLIGDLVVFATLGYPSPMHAYASSMTVFIFYHGYHMIVGLVIATLVLGTLYRGRLAGREYTAELVGLPPGGAGHGSGRPAFGR